jgi:acetoin utilization deacetylase AcuC-like enzyme
MWSSAAYSIPLPAGHRFPIEKYAMLRDAVIAEGLARADEIQTPQRATREELLLVHSPRYLDGMMEGTLPDAEMRRVGFPWSPELVERSVRTVGATVAATRAALDRGMAMSLAGGTHHAFPDHGEGFCVFNDVAVATRLLQRESPAMRVAIVDLDVHQGNGTNFVFAGDERVYTFSMHGGRNYPFRQSPIAVAPDGTVDSWGLRVAGSLDIDLPDAVGDDEYLATLERALPTVLRDARADLVIYLAGADPHEGDRLGRMRLTFAGLARRDALVLECCREVGLPVTIVIAGGYGRDIRDTIRVHVSTVRIASEMV